MTLNIYPFSNNINFEQSHVNTLEIRNTKLFYNISRSLIMYCDNTEGIENIKLYDKKGSEISIHKNVLIINNLFEININEKKILTKLYEAISKDFSEDIEIVEKVNIGYNKLLQYFNDIFNNYDLEFEYNIDFSIKNYLKMIQLEFYEENVDFIKNIYYLADIISEFNLYNLIVFNNLKAYLSDDELFEFYKYCNYKKVNILLLEPNGNRSLLEYEKKLIIDEDYHDYIQKL